MTLLADELLVDQLFVSLADGRPSGVVGRIVEVGEAHVAERDRLVGRAVVIPSSRSCGACLPCRRGHALLCRMPGAPPSREPRTTVAHRLAVVLAPPGSPGLAEPADLAPLAALAGVGLWAYGAVVRASVEPNRAAIIVGQGPLARFVAALVVHRGARAVSSIDALSELDPFGLPVIATSPGCASAAIDLCPDGGTVVLCHEAPGAAELARVAARGLAVHGVLGAHPDLLPELVAFSHRGNLALEALCSDAAAPYDDRVPVVRI